MTIEELYGRVMADDDLKAQLAQAASEGRVAEWAAAQGVEATEEELLAYVHAAAAGGQELTDEQLDKVAGGGYVSAWKSLGEVWENGAKGIFNCSH